MRLPRLGRSGFVVLVSLSLAGGCVIDAFAAHAVDTRSTSARGSVALGSSPAPLQGVRHSGWLAPEAKSGSGLLFVSNVRDGGIEVFRNTHLAPLVGFITEGVSEPYGVFVSPQKSLYVCNISTRTVTVYPPGHFRPTVTYRAGIVLPLFVTVDVAQTVYVSNYKGWIRGGLVSVFAAGSLTPTRILVTPGVEADGLAVDSSGNLDVSYRYVTGEGGIVQFAPGSNNWKDLGIRIDQPQGLTIDSADDIIVVDTGARVVDIFPPGATQPAKQIRGFKKPNSVAYDPVHSRLYVSSQRGDTAVYALQYPNGKAQSRIPNLFGGIVGVAFSPGGSP